MSYKFTVVINREGKWFVAHCVELGVVSQGKTIDEALKISKATVAEALDGLPPQKMHCSNLAADALKAAIEEYQNKGNKQKNNFK